MSALCAVLRLKWMTWDKKKTEYESCIRPIERTLVKEPCAKSWHCAGLFQHALKE